MRNALLRFELEELKRTDWLQEGVMQVVLTISAVVFTRIVEDCGESELGDLAQQI